MRRRTSEIIKNLKAKYGRACQRIARLETQVEQLKGQVGYPYELDERMCLEPGCGRKPVGLGYCAHCLGIKKAAAEGLASAVAPARGQCRVSQRKLGGDVAFFT